MGTLGARTGRMVAVAAMTGAACCALLVVAGPGPAAAVAVPAKALAAVPLAAVPLAAVPLATVPLAAVPLATVPSTASAAGVWGPVHVIPDTPALGGEAWPTVLSCGGPGDCVAAGGVSGFPAPPSPAGASVDSVAEEKHGVWGQASMSPGLAPLAAGAQIQVNAVSCGSPGNCVLGGYYTPYSPTFYEQYAFLATEKHGRWDNAEDVPGLAALDAGDRAEITSISCTGAGDCTAAGFTTLDGLLSGPGEQDGFVIDEKNGVWGKARLVPGITMKTGELAQILTVSCASPGNCAVGGYVKNDVPAKPDNVAFVAEEKNGAWHPARLIPAITSVTLVSCPAAGDCAAAGAGGPASCLSTSYYTCVSTAYVTEKNGTWGAPRAVLPASQARTLIASATSLSCGARGDCVLGGSVSHADGTTAQAFLLAEKNGTWGAYRAVPGIAALNRGGSAAVDSVSCTAPGDCDAGGSYAKSKGAQSEFLITETGGSWGKPDTTIGGTAVGVIACSAPASCAALVTTSAGASVMDKEPVQATRTTIALSRARVAYRNEKAVRVSATVTAALGDPTGAVIVDSGATTICVIGLVSGRGSCTLAATVLAAGTHTLTGYYLGEPQFRGSASAGRTLTITPAGTGTAEAEVIAQRVT
jgi:Bacterial Ig-like domain (group 3)